MIIRASNPNTYTRLLNAYNRERELDTPENTKGYIERTNQPPINAFLNVSLRNFQGRPMRLGHLSLSLMKPAQLEVLAWAHELRGNPQSMKFLRDALILDLVSVAESRQRGKSQLVS